MKRNWYFNFMQKILFVSFVSKERYLSVWVPTEYFIWLCVWVCCVFGLSMCITQFLILFCLFPFMAFYFSSCSWWLLFDKANSMNEDSGFVTNTQHQPSQVYRWSGNKYHRRHNYKYKNNNQKYLLLSLCPHILVNKANTSVEPSE